MDPLLSQLTYRWLGSCENSFLEPVVLVGFLSMTDGRPFYACVVSRVARKQGHLRDHLRERKIRGLCNELSDHHQMFQNHAGKLKLCLCFLGQNQQRASECKETNIRAGDFLLLLRTQLFSFLDESCYSEPQKQFIRMTAIPAKQTSSYAGN